MCSHPHLLLLFLPFFVLQSNEIRYLLVNATTRRNPENQIVGVVAVAQDVTETAIANNHLPSYEEVVRLRKK